MTNTIIIIGLLTVGICVIGLIVKLTKIKKEDSKE